MTQPPCLNFEMTSCPPRGRIAPRMREPDFARADGGGPSPARTIAEGLQPRKPANGAGKAVKNSASVLIRGAYVGPPCHGGVAEWSIVPDSKSGVPERVPWVRIPPPPPFSAGELRCFHPLSPTPGDLPAGAGGRTNNTTSTASSAKTGRANPAPPPNHRARGRSPVSAQ